MSEQGTDKQNLEKVNDLIVDSGPIAMLTTRSPEGKLTSRPMTLQEVEFDGDLWFLTATSSDQVTHVAGDSEVNVSFGSSSSWISLSGSASTSDDSEKKKELWNAAVETWFPDESPESPEVTLLRVEGESVEYWDSPGQVATLLDMAKARISGDQPEAGHSDSMKL